jgi:hypothetical protein
MKKLLIAIFLIFFMMGAFFVQVKYFGVSIDNFRFNSYYVEKLYIKLDEKLIVQAQKIEIPQQISKETTPSFDIKQTVHYIFEVLKYFDRIEVGSLSIGEEIFSISYNKEVLYFDNNAINLSAKATLDGNLVQLDLNSLFFKEYDALSVGTLKIDLKKEELSYIGNFSYQDFIGEMKFSANKEYVDFFLNTSKFENIKFVKNFVTLHPIIEKWMYDSVFGEYKLEFLKGRIDLATSKLLVDTLEGSASVQNAKIRFHDDLDFVNTDAVNVFYKDQKLSFKLVNPIYKNISINGSFVEISDMLGEVPYIVINIKTNHMLEQNILNILKAYKIDIPIVQKSGNTEASVMIKVYLKTGEVEANGEFEVKNSLVSVEQLDFFAKKGLVILKNYIVEIKNLEASMDDFLDISGNMSIDTSKKMIYGNGIIDKFIIKNENDEFLHIKNHNSKFSYDMKEKTLNLDDLSFALKQKDGFLDITLNDLLILKPYLNGIDLSNLYHGVLMLKMYNPKDIEFNTNITFNESILSKNDQRVTNFIFDGTYKNNILAMKNYNDSIVFKMEKNKVDLDLDGYDVFYIKDENESDSKSALNINVKSKNGNIFYNTTQILSDGFVLNKTNNSVQFESKYLDSSLKIVQDNVQTTLQGDNLNDEFVNTFLGKKIIEGGIVNINLHTSHSDKTIFQGEITLSDTNLKNIAFLNNLLTFIETSPAIINPLLAIPSAYRAIQDGIGYDGYMVKNGILNVTYDTDADVLNIYEGYLKGSRSDLAGSIQIDRKNKLVDGNVNVIILKDYTSVVKYIPVVGYILLGDDKSVAISTKISGDMDDPKVETFATSDAIKGTGNILKRIITAPFKIFE